MYELRKGTMRLLIQNKKDVEIYIKNGWYLVEKIKTKTTEKKNNQEKDNKVGK